MYPEAAMSETFEVVADGGVTSARGFVAGAVPARMRLDWGKPDGAVVSSGGADAVAMAQLSGVRLGLDPHDVVVASTGVIGTFLPMDRVRQGIEAVELSVGGGPAFARGIMTTDTRPKQSAVRFGEYKLGGACKGAGMIHPDMATMLAFITTDAPVAAPFLSRALT